MFNFETARLKSKISDLEHSLYLSNENVRILNERIKAMELEKVDAIKEDVNTSVFKIDWNKMDAFSIERMGDNNAAYTVIGHHMTDEHNVKHIHEWKFYCSHEQHNKLAEEFNNGTAKANNFAVRERSHSKRARK